MACCVEGGTSGRRGIDSRFLIVMDLFAEALFALIILCCCSGAKLQRFLFCLAKENDSVYCFLTRHYWLEMKIPFPLSPVLPVHFFLSPLSLIHIYHQQDLHI